MDSVTDERVRVSCSPGEVWAREEAYIETHSVNMNYRMKRRDRYTANAGAKIGVAEVETFGRLECNRSGTTRTYKRVTHTGGGGRYNRIEIFSKTIYTDSRMYDNRDRYT